MDMQVSRIGLALFVISVGIGLSLAGLVTNHPWPLFVTVPIGVYFLFAIKVADQWQKAVVLRLGKYVGLRGPGTFHIIPIVDTVSRFVDQRVRVASVSAESTLTRDTGISVSTSVVVVVAYRRNRL
jgi:regulator of protease activity HflC (stomatin/prohibitin superfamily)